VPYPIDNGTTIQTDPAITRGGVTDFGKIYRDNAQDGAFSTWAFTTPSAFDATAGIDALYGPNVPVAAFKFVTMQLVGDPVISTANGGATNLALLSIGGITSAPAGNAVFTFAGMQSVLLATENGSIDISGTDMLFRGIPTLTFYARGPGSSLTLGGMGILNVGNLRLVAENNIQINAPESLTNGANGGTLRGTAGSNFNVNSLIETPTAFGPVGTFSGNGGTVSLSALNGNLGVASRIQASFDDPTPAGATPVRRSATGGVITLDSGLTTGNGITLSPNSGLLSLLDPAAPGPGGSITLTTAGSNIAANGATIEADRGTITIQQSAAASTGTALITLDGGAITSETLLVSSRGDLTIGSSTPVNLFAVNLALVASRNLFWSGGKLAATATASPGNVLVQSGGTLTIATGTDIQRFNGGITSGLNMLINAGTTLQTNALHLLTDGSGLTTGANITVRSGGTMTFNGLANFEANTSTADQANGSNLVIQAGGAITASDLLGVVQIGAGRTLTNGGNISLSATSSYTATLAAGGLSLQVNNSSPGIIGTGGNISLTLETGLTTGNTGALNLVVNNQGGRIQTGANITSTIGSLSASSVNVQINNLGKGFIGTGAGVTFTVNGATTVSGAATFSILNSQGGPGAGTIVSDALIKIILGDTTIGGNLNAFVQNPDGAIGGTGGTTTLQINGRLTVTNRIAVLGTLTATGTITAREFSVANANAPTISVGAGGITRFSFLNGAITPFQPQSITTNALTSTGGINFNGPDLGPFGGPFDGGTLTLNVPSLTFGPSAADNIQGPVTFNGGSSPGPTGAGGGGFLNVNATGAITVGSPIQATTGLRSDTSLPSGVGGTVNLVSTGGTIGVSAPITVSSADPSTGANRRRSNTGGNINLQSNSGNAVAINISSTGQLLSLLDAAATGPGGKITILATGAGSINVNGDPSPVGAATLGTIRADGQGGSVDIRHTGAAGAISLSNAQVSADIVKIGALGNAGTLTIGGGRISAENTLKLYAPGPNGSITFIASVTLGGNSVTKILAANSITINNGVRVDITGPRPVQIFTNAPNYAGFGGNSTTTGTFTGMGAQDPLPLANAPAFGPPGGP
jgi:hypothetical protein